MARETDEGTSYHYFAGSEEIRNLKDYGFSLGNQSMAIALECGIAF
jgi:hypothetical protein